MFLASDHPYTSNWHRFRHFASPILEPDKLPAFRQIKPIFYVILPFFEPLIKRGMFGICSKIAEKGIFVSDSEVSKMPKIPFLVVLVICIYIFGCFMPRVFFEGPSCVLRYSARSHHVGRCGARHVHRGLPPPAAAHHFHVGQHPWRRRHCNHRATHAAQGLGDLFVRASGWVGG